MLPEAAVLVGRDPDCDLVLSDETIGRRALEVVWDGREARIRNLDPRQRTYYGEARVGEISIGFGAEIRLGHSCLRVQPSEQRLSSERTRHDRFGTLRGRHERTREVLSILGDIAPTDVTVLLEGERGTGKERAARTLHDHSRRARGPYLVIDCTTVPRDLMANLLFGTQTRAGAIDRASGGTLFLKEIDRLDLSLQPRLLDLLEEQTACRAGHDAFTRMNVRVVAATDRDLKREVRAGRFREDLYYRLAAVKLTLPPLRERREDIPLLVEAFLDGLGADPEVRRRITTPRNIDALLAHTWPGNARELQSLIEVALSRPRSANVDLADLMAHRGEGMDDGEAAPCEAYSQPCHRAFGQGTQPPTFKEAKQSVVETFERQYLEDLLHRNDGNVSKASREAGMDRKHLKALMKKHGMGT
jgi:DNA-binding NtrC family response regulator